jgi:hypothetical protein
MIYITLAYCHCVFAVCMHGDKTSEKKPMSLYSEREQAGDAECAYSDMPWLRDMKYQILLGGPVHEGVLPDSSPPDDGALQVRRLN